MSGFHFYRHIDDYIIHHDIVCFFWPTTAASFPARSTLAAPLTKSQCHFRQAQVNVFAFAPIWWFHGSRGGCVYTVILWYLFLTWNYTWFCTSNRQARQKHFPPYAYCSSSLQTHSPANLTSFFQCSFFPKCFASNLNPSFSCVEPY